MHPEGRGGDGLSTLASKGPDKQTYPSHQKAASELFAVFKGMVGGEAWGAQRSVQRNASRDRAWPCAPPAVAPSCAAASGTSLKVPGRLSL